MFLVLFMLRVKWNMECENIFPNNCFYGYEMINLIGGGIEVE